MEICKAVTLMLEQCDVSTAANVGMQNVLSIVVTINAPCGGLSRKATSDPSGLPE